MLDFLHFLKSFFLSGNGQICNYLVEIFIVEIFILDPFDSKDAIDFRSDGLLDLGGEIPEFSSIRRHFDDFKVVLRAEGFPEFRVFN